MPGRHIQFSLSTTALQNYLYVPHRIASHIDIYTVYYISLSAAIVHSSNNKLIYLQVPAVDCAPCIASNTVRPSTFFFPHLRPPRYDWIEPNLQDKGTTLRAKTQKSLSPEIKGYRKNTTFLAHSIPACVCLPSLPTRITTATASCHYHHAAPEKIAAD